MQLLKVILTGIKALVFCYLYTVASASANEAPNERAVSLSSELSFYQPLAAHIGYWLDPNLERSVEEVASQPSLFAPFIGSTIGFSVTPARIWLKADLYNPENAVGTWRIDVNRIHYQELQIFIARENGKIEQILQHRETDHFDARLPGTRLLGQNVTLSANETVTAYIAYRSRTSSYIPLAVGTIAATQALHEQDDRLNWSLNGALISMVAFALIMLPVIGRSLSLAFCGYLLAGTFFVFHADGYSAKYLWPSQVQYSDAIHMSVMMLIPLFGLHFARMMFNFSSIAPRFEKLIFGYSAIAALVVVSSILITRNQSLTLLAYYIAPIGSLLQFASGTIAMRHRLLGWLPYFIGTLIVIAPFLYAVSAHVLPFEFNVRATLDFSHASLVTEGLAFAFAIALRMLGLRGERDGALRAELLATQEKLALASDLQRSQEDYIQARKLSDIRRAQLSNVTHDLQQPLASLRKAIGNLTGDDEQSAANMQHAFDYLEQLAVDQPISGESTLNPLETEETFPISVVLDNVVAMFSADAEAKNMELRYRGSDIMVRSQPITLLRIINNLVTNAIKHSGAQTILLAARERKEELRIEIWDNGVGVAAEQIELLQQANQKGPKSEGSGLGLAIVTELADRFALEYEFHSREHQGTRAVITVPKA